MSDPNRDLELPEGSPPAPAFGSTYLDDIEVLIEDPASRVNMSAEEIEEMKKKLEAQDAVIKDLQTRSDTAAAVQAGIAGLAQTLRQNPAVPVAQPPAPMQQPGESDEDFRKRLDEGLLERGATATMEEYIGRKLKPEVDRLFSANLSNSRRFVTLDPSRGPLYQKYKAEVEQMVAALPAAAKLYDPEVYEKVTDRVASLHANEIIDEQVAARVKIELEKITAAQPPVKPGPIPAVPASRGQQPPAAPARKTVSLTAEEAAYAKAHLIHPAEYAAYLLRKGMKK